jgi:uncharacterized LabA/DUF88 family protein
VRSDRDIVARLGSAGLERALGDVLDPSRLIKLANTVGLSYPGMRTQSQKRSKLIADLAGKAARDDAAARAVVRLLRKESSGAAKDWGSLGAELQAARLTDPSPAGANGKLGAYLFVAAAGPLEPGLDDELTRTLGSLDRATPGGAKADDAVKPSEPAEREVGRLRKKSSELQKKVRYLEGQIAKTKDVEKTYKRDLMLRKGELAEARMLAEKLRRDVEDLRQSKAGTTAPDKAAGSLPEVGELDRTVKRLTSEQRRLTHRIEKLVDAPPPIVTIPDDTLSPVVAALAELQKDVQALRRERRKDLQDQAKRIDAVSVAVEAARQALETSPKVPRSASRKKGDLERVGVFIDVQNMYYAARQLKGKLDFDALLAASVLDRRLIQATAYVVESKEIDQSGFIAMLQQRAIEVRRKTLKVRSDGSMKGDWDMEMALDILDMAPKLDVVVLVSGDGDFTSLVKRVKGMGPKVEVVAFPRNTAKSLLEAADRFHPLDRRAMIRSGDGGHAEPDAPKAETPKPAPSPEPAPEPSAAAK